MSNLLKYGWVDLNVTDKRVIDTNEYVNRKLEDLAASGSKENRVFRAEPDADGFSSGFDAEVLDGMVEEEPADLQNEMAQMQEELALMQQQAQELVANAQQEAQQIRMLANEEASRLREEAQQEGFQRGYEEGRMRANDELAREEEGLKEKEQQLMMSYEKQIAQLEPLFIDNLTSIYEHIFHTELRSYREILSYLIGNTMKQAMDSHNFFVHISKEDYAFVSEQKQQLMEMVGRSNITIDIVEDITLSANACLIETDGGVFDCGVDTQLQELTNRLKLLSYERA